MYPNSVDCRVTAITSGRSAHTWDKIFLDGQILNPGSLVLSVIITHRAFINLGISGAAMARDDRKIGQGP